MLFPYAYPLCLQPDLDNVQQLNIQHSCQCWPGWYGLIFYFHPITYRFVHVFKSWRNKSNPLVRNLPTLIFYVILLNIPSKKTQLIVKRLSAWFAVVTWLLTETGTEPEVRAYVYMVMYPRSKGNVSVYYN